MSKILKRKYRSERKQFKHELYEAMKNDLQMAMLIQQIFINRTQRSIIYETWYRLGTQYPQVYKEGFCEDNSLHGKMMTGRSHEVFHNLYFINNELYMKYHRKIPEVYALGDALAVAYRVFRENK